jgi:MYXO-CTERM domain-containing protein
MRFSKMTVVALSLGVAFLFRVPLAHAAAGQVYVAQSQSGSGDGSSCANAKDVTFFNAGGSWGSGSSQIGPGSTLHLCGTITTALTAGGNGTSGAPITVRWEPAASLRVCDTTGAFRLPGRSFVSLDLGGNANAITCPNNGTALATQVDAVGITDAGSGFNHIEIHNGTVGPMYLYSGAANDGFGSACINASQDAASSHLHHLELKGCANGINYSLGPGDSVDDEFDHLTTGTTVGRVINYASGADGATFTSTNPTIHDLDVDYSTVWAVPADYLHYEWIHVYNRGIAGSHDTISNLQIYNNSFHGVTPNNAGSTGGIFISEGGSNCSPSSSMSVRIFNNLVVNGPGGIGFSSGAGGFIYEQDCEHSVEVYNNTINGGDSSMNSCFELNGTTGSSWVVKNNICMNVQFAFYNPQGTAPALTSDHNILYRIRSSGNGGYDWRNTVYNTLAGFSAATGQDGNSSTADPQLNPDDTVASATSLANTLPGENLGSLGIAALAAAKPLTVGAGGSSNATIRPSGGSWTVGAYEYGGTDGGPGDGGPDGGPADAGIDAGPGDGGADAGPQAGDSGIPGGSDGGVDAGGGSPGPAGASGGCGCTVSEESRSSGFFGFAFALAVFGLRRPDR